jgi:hypothetical protein
VGSPDESQHEQRSMGRMKNRTPIFLATNTLLPQQ